MRFLTFRRTRETAPATAVPAPSCVPAACQDLEALPRLFSPLVTEMMATFYHTRQLAALSQSERSAAYQMAARSVTHHVLEGWQHQTGGRGTIDDLLLQPRASHRMGAAKSRPAPRPGMGEHSYAS